MIRSITFGGILLGVTVLLRLNHGRRRRRASNERRQQQEDTACPQDQNVDGNAVVAKKLEDSTPDDAPTSPTISTQQFHHPLRDMARMTVETFLHLVPQGETRFVSNGIRRVVVCHRTGSHFYEKVLSCSSWNPESISRAWCELHIVTSLSHTCAFLLPGCAFRDVHSLYLLLAFCPAGEAGQYFQEGQESTLEVCKIVAAQILLGLTTLHEAGIIHRDLCLENILVSVDGNVCLGDFGWATKSPTFQNHQAGVLYKAPEVADGSLESMGSDVWSYAILVYRMLLGTFPFPSLHQEERVHDPWWVDAIWRVSSILDRSPEACSFFATVFKVNKEERPSARELQGHAFFQGIDWENLARGTAEGPLLDKIQGAVPPPLEHPAVRSLRFVQGPVTEVTAGPEEQ